MEWAQRYLRLVKYLLSDKKNHKNSADTLTSPEPHFPEPGLPRPGQY